MAARAAAALATLAAAAPVFADVGLPRLEVVLSEPASTGRRTVRVEAPGLAREAVADDAGRAVFFGLAPGDYRVWLVDPATDAEPACSTSAVMFPDRDLRLELRCVPAGASADSRARAALAGARTAFDAADLRSRPRPQDAWSVLREVPGIVVDRVNVGGSDTALSSLLVSHGDPGTGAVWTLDGVDVTDPVSLGAPLLYPPLDPLEALVAQTGGTDVHARTPGVQVALFSRAPEDALAGRLDVRFAPDAFQSDNLPPGLAGRSLARGRTDAVLDLAAEAGLPVGRRLWLWGSASRYALNQTAFTGHAEKLRSSTLLARARLRLGMGATSALLLRSEKTHDDRDPTLQSAPEARWRQSGSTWLASLRDERSLGSFSLLSRLAWVQGGFRLVPLGGAGTSVFEDVKGLTKRSYARFETERGRLQAGLEATTRLSGLGFQHDVAAGVGYRRAPVVTRQSWPGNGTLGIEQGGVFFRTFRLTGFAVAYRDLAAESVQDQAEVWLRDTARRGRTTLSLGARLDRLTGHNRAASVEPNPAFPALLPALAFRGSEPRFSWVDLLPRVGVSFDVDRASGLAASARYSAYGAPLGSADVSFDNPLAAGASSTWYWLDRDGDRTVERGELDAVRGEIGTSGIDPDQPGSVVPINRIDPSLDSPRTHELATGLSWAPGPALRVSFEACHRRLDHALWRPLRGLTSADYVATGAVTGELFGHSYSRAFYAPATTSRLTPGYGRELTNRDGYRQESVTLSLGAGGRAFERLDWRAWGAFMDWWERFPDREQAVQDPTPLDAEPLQDFGRVIVRAGGLGRGDLFVGARWMAGTSLFARLPWRLEAALSVSAREGFPIPYLQVASTGDPTAGSKSVLVAPAVDSYRLPSLVLVDARLARGFTLGPGRLSVSLDVFNLANAGTELQVARDVELAGFDRTREIVRPRIFRLGLSWLF